MDDLVDPSSSITDNIAKIDQLFEQHCIGKLREMIDLHNKKIPRNKSSMRTPQITLDPL